MTRPEEQEIIRRILKIHKRVNSIKSIVDILLLIHLLRAINWLLQFLT